MAAKSDVRITQDELKSIAQKMQALPHAREAELTSKKEVIEALSSQIEIMRQKGYSIAEIAEWLSRNTPLQIGVATLRSALPGGKRKRKRQTRKAKISAKSPASRESMSSDPEVRIAVPEPASKHSREAKGDFPLGSDEI